jgi:hypothetical protein
LLGHGGLRRHGTFIVLCGLLTSALAGAALAARPTPAALSAYSCGRLNQMLGRIIGSKPRTPQPLDMRWTAGSLKGGCAFEGRDGSIEVEVHLANTHQHSDAWILAPTNQRERRQEHVAGLGDEAYMLPDPNGMLRLLARKGYVEVFIGTSFLGTGALLTREQAIRLAAAILAPWPDGPGPSTPTVDWPRTIPLPPGTVRRDVVRYDPDAVWTAIRKANPKAAIPRELGPGAFWVESTSTPGEITTYCAALARAGYANDPLAKYEEKSAGSRCSGSDGRWLVTVSEETTGSYLTMVMSLPAVEQYIRVCKSHPNWCAN